MIVILSVFVLFELSFSQVTAIGHITCEVVRLEPLSIQNISNMEFGNIKNEYNVITIDPVFISGIPQSAKSISRSEISATITEIEISNQNRLPSVFKIEGKSDCTYGISLPSCISIKRIDGLETMLVDGFTSCPSKEGVLNSNGNSAISVGATLHVGIAQTPGLYKSSQGGFDIVVNYN